MALPATKVNFISFCKNLKRKEQEKFISNWQIDVSFLCVCPVIDHEFRHHIVKVAVDPRGDGRVDP